LKTGGTRDGIGIDTYFFRHTERRKAVMKVKIKSDTTVDCLFTNLISPYDIRDYRLVATAREFPETFVLPTVTVKSQGRLPVMAETLHNLNPK
jgi:hypothetical protein